MVRVHHLFIAPPPCKAYLLQYYCTAIAQYTPLDRPPFLWHTPYKIGAIIPCKGQMLLRYSKVALLVAVAFTRYCHYQSCMAHGVSKGGGGGVFNCAIDMP